MNGVQSVVKAASETTMSHYPTCKVKPMLESNQLISVEFNFSQRRTIHTPISKQIGSTNQLKSTLIDVCPRFKSNYNNYHIRNQTT